MHTYRTRTIADLDDIEARILAANPEHIDSADLDAIEGDLARVTADLGLVHLWNNDVARASQATLYVPRLDALLNEPTYIYADTERQEVAERACPLPDSPLP